MPRVESSAERAFGFIFPLVGVLLLLVACPLICARHVFWFDELLTYYPATDPSFAHMLRTLGDLINSAPPLYFVLMWIWAHLFGGTELSLRLASSVAFGGALVVLFRLLRHRFGTFPAGFGSLAWFLGSTNISFENANARSYGLLVLELALAATAYDALLRSERVSRRVAAANVAAHVALAMTHYLALFYSATFFLAAMAYEAITQRRAWRRATWIPIGMLAFIPWLPIFIRHSEFSRPHGWIPTPQLPDLVTGLNLGVPVVGFITLILLAGAWATRSPETSVRSSAGPTDLRNEGLPLLVLAFGLAALPAGMWVYSRLGTSIYYDRYYFSAGMAWALLWAAAAAQLQERTAAMRRGVLRQIPRILQSVALLILGAVFVLTALTLPDQLSPSLDEPPASVVDPETGATESLADLPIVEESPMAFLTRYFYNVEVRDPQRNVGLLDWETAVDPRSPPAAVDCDMIARALKRQYPLLPIVESSEFLQAHRAFLVYPSVGWRWLPNRILANPRFRYRRVFGAQGQLFFYVKDAPDGAGLPPVALPAPEGI